MLAFITTRPGPGYYRTLNSVSSANLFETYSKSKPDSYLDGVLYCQLANFNATAKVCYL